MIQTKSLKGQQCHIKPILCQEGWCSGCRIYHNYQAHQTTMGRNSNVIGKWHGNNEVCLKCGASRTALREMINKGDRSNLTIVNHILEGCPACAKALGESK